MYKTDMGILIKDIVGSKGYHVYKMWSNKKEDIGLVVDRLNKKLLVSVDDSKKEEIIVSNEFKQLEFKF